MFCVIVGISGFSDVIALWLSALCEIVDALGFSGSMDVWIVVSLWTFSVSSYTKMGSVSSSMVITSG